MTPKITEMLGIDFPLLAFSHCRDVVVAVSKAGGLGVFGAVHYTPEQLRVELDWIDRNIDGRPYAIDLVMPASFVRNEEGEEFDPQELWTHVPESHVDFANELCDKHGIPALAEGTELRDTSQLAWSHRVALEQLEIALEHSPALLVNALGVPPPDVIERVHAKGILVGALAGRVRHALKQRDAGVDIVIANGHEAAGHTGDITTMVLVPQIVKAVAPLPVLAAGGIGSGEQMAAAMVLGAQGAWCGSIWLTSTESELDPSLREKLIHASSEETSRTRCVTGKPARHLVTPYTEAWDSPDTLDPLPMPLQTMATTEALYRINAQLGGKGEAGDAARDLVTTPVGQVVGAIGQIRSCRVIVQDFIDGYADSLDRIEDLLS